MRKITMQAKITITVNADDNVTMAHIIDKTKIKVTANSSKFDIEDFQISDEDYAVIDSR